jgi:hypothetical protein
LENAADDESAVSVLEGLKSMKEINLAMSKELMLVLEELNSFGKLKIYVTRVVFRSNRCSKAG